jgi:hypothetical protein
MHTGWRMGEREREREEKHAEGFEGGELARGAKMSWHLRRAGGVEGKRQRRRDEGNGGVRRREKERQNILERAQEIK